jgi:hypothetical protein
VFVIIFSPKILLLPTFFSRSIYCQPRAIDFGMPANSRKPLQNQTKIILAEFLTAFFESSARAENYPKG